MEHSWFCLLLFLMTFIYCVPSEDYALPNSTLSVEPTSPYTGENVTLTCSAGSDSDWRYKWYKNSSIIAVNQSDRHSTTGDTLIISRVEESDQGLYWCQGERKNTPTSTSISNQVNITVKAQPKSMLALTVNGDKVHSDKEDVLTGDRVTLTCTVESSGWRFYWYRDRPDSPPVTTTESTYTFNPVSVSDGGQYWCRGGRGEPPYYTLISDPVRITVTERPVAVLTIQPNWTQIFIGETVTLRCVLLGGGDTDWQYEWFHYQNISQTGPEYRISPVRTSHNGSYRCKGVKGRKTSNHSNVVQLTVSALPKATLTVDPNPVFTGEKVTLTCSVESVGYWIEYEWYTDNKNNRYRLSEHSGAPFTINSVTVSDWGPYWCQGRLHSRTTTSDISNQVTITVNALPTATLILYPTSPYIGETVTLTCSVNSEGNWRYNWYKDRRNIPVTHSGRLSIRENILTISSVIKSDKGSYQCHGNLDDRPTSTSTSNLVTITVKALPKATLTVDQNPVFTGEKVTLTCSVGSSNDWTRYVWYKDNTFNNNILYQYNSATLTINSVKESDQGLYWCQGILNSRPTSSSISNQVTITVNALPNSTLSVEPTSPYTGEKVTLTCSAGSDRDWRYKWYNNRSIIAVNQSDRHSTTGDTLIISRVEESDQGLYWCQGERDSRPTSTSISNQVIITVKAPGFSTSLLVGVVVGLVVGVFLLVLLGLMCRYKNSKRSCCTRTSLSPQTQITNQDPQQDLLQHGQSLRPDLCHSLSETSYTDLTTFTIHNNMLPSMNSMSPDKQRMTVFLCLLQPTGGAPIYDTINPSDHNDRVVAGSSSASGTGDVTYALIQLNQLKKQKKGKPSDPTENPVYSEVQTENASGPVDVTYAEIDLNKKTKKKKKRGSTPPPETEPVYSEVKPRKGP